MPQPRADHERQPQILPIYLTKTFRGGVVERLENYKQTYQNPFPGLLNQLGEFLDFLHPHVVNTVVDAPNIPGLYGGQSTRYNVVDPISFVHSLPDLSEVSRLNSLCIHRCSHHRYSGPALRRCQPFLLEWFLLTPTRKVELLGWFRKEDLGAQQFRAGSGNRWVLRTILPRFRRVPSDENGLAAFPITLMTHDTPRK